MSEDNELSYSAAIQEASTSISRFPLIPVKGIPLMSLIAINFDAISAFCPDSSDLLIATYPKAGTTWTQEIVDLLLHNGDAVACRRAPTLLRSPFLEIWSPPRIPSVSWGSWYDHVKGYWEEREKRNILYIFYEDMKENPRREVERIMRYLDLSLSDDVIGRIVELTSFKAMKENPMANYTFIPKNVFDQSISDFMRKGEVGDWKNHFTLEQSAEFDEDYEKQMKQVNIPFRTEI
ncbi:sulfotransferase 1C2 isoform X4 [Phyllopteryx taeniolatus]|uniref:sulfotransferase 1C2 isoform X4 n=1 Tax=Phyllopteryx taeniolatus TaxID=161469 RepID=UPI002AD4A038|nr:sulfotransferase 1C2 isoform X4 [Phyllopteryx taeniolatus]